MEEKLKIFHKSTIFKDIQILEKNINIPFPPKGTSLSAYDFEVSIDYLIYNNEKLLIKTVKVLIINSIEKNIMANFRIAYAFEISNFDEYVDNDGKLDFEFNDWLDHVVIATTRGAMYSELRGTILDKATLPLTMPLNTS